MKKNTLFYLVLILGFTACKKNNTINVNFLEGVWAVQYKGFATHRDYYYYTFYDNNDCKVFALRDRYYNSTDTTIYKKYKFDDQEKTLVIFEGSYENNPKNIEKYKITSLTLTSMRWKNELSKNELEIDLKKRTEE